MSEHPLVTILRNSGDKPYRKLVEHHMRQQSTDKLRLGCLGTVQMLPEGIQNLNIEFIDAVNNAFGYDNHFWDYADVKTAFGYIIQTAIQVLPIKNWISCEQDAYQPENYELALNLFQVATMNFAYSASTQRKQRKHMGIRKGFFR
jgi:hypothetical protein